MPDRPAPVSRRRAPPHRRHDRVVDGATWTLASGESDDGRRLRRVPTRRLYAFARQDDHGPDAFYVG